MPYTLSLKHFYVIIHYFSTRSIHVGRKSAVWFIGHLLCRISKKNIHGYNWQDTKVSCCLPVSCFVSQFTIVIFFATQSSKIGVCVIDGAGMVWLWLHSPATRLDLGVMATSGFVFLLYSALRGFSPGSLVFLLSSKISISKFHLNRMHDLPENYSRVNGASWENICGTKPSVIVEKPKGECENNLFYYNFNITKSPLASLLFKGNLSWIVLNLIRCMPILSVTKANVLALTFIVN